MTGPANPGLGCPVPGLGSPGLGADLAVSLECDAVKLRIGVS